MQLASLIELGFFVPQMSEMLQISKRTIQRRMTQYGLSSKSWSEISDVELDRIVSGVKLYNPDCDSKNWHTGKPGPGTQRWDAKVGRKGGKQVINV